MKKTGRVILLALMLAAAAVSAGKVRLALSGDKAGISAAATADKILGKSDSAQLFVGCSGEFVAVFSDRRQNRLVETTEIELSTLRKGDVDMLKKGIPVMNETEMLRLLEDLGS